MVDYPPPSAVSPFPKIAAIIGAHTDIGQHLLRDLLESPEIEKVHAIATDDVPILDRLPSNVLRKARVHLLSFENLDRAFRRIPECDIGFCVSTTDRHAYNIIGNTRFRQLNYSGPLQFIEKMFELGVLHISILSHVNADKDSRSEFYKLKGMLESFTRDLRREAGEFSPYISIFKTPTPVVSASSTRSSRDRLRSRVADSLGADALTQPVEVREIVLAMQLDSFAKAASKRPPGSKKKRTRYEEYYADDVLRMLRNAREY